MEIVWGKELKFVIQRRNSNRILVKEVN